MAPRIEPRTMNRIWIVLRDDFEVAAAAAAVAENEDSAVEVMVGVEVGVGLGNEDRWKKFEEAGLDELREPGESRTAFLLRFTLSHPDVQTIIVGTLYPEHLQENIAAVKQGALPPDVYEEAKLRLDRIGVTPAPTG